MKNSLIKYGIVLLALCNLVLTGAEAQENSPLVPAQTEQWKPLLSGKDLSGWHLQKQRGQHGTGGH